MHIHIVVQPLMFGKVYSWTSSTKGSLQENTALPTCNANIRSSEASGVLTYLHLDSVTQAVLLRWPQAVKTAVLPVIM